MSTSSTGGNRPLIGKNHFQTADAYVTTSTLQTETAAIVAEKHSEPGRSRQHKRVGIEEN